MGMAPLLIGVAGHQGVTKALEKMSALCHWNENGTPTATCANILLVLLLLSASNKIRIRLQFERTLAPLAEAACPKSVHGALQGVVFPAE